MSRVAWIGAALVVAAGAVAAVRAPAEEPKAAVVVRANEVVNVGGPAAPFLVDTRFGQLRIRRGDVALHLGGVKADPCTFSLEDATFGRQTLSLAAPALKWDGRTLEWNGKTHDTSAFGTYRLGNPIALVRSVDVGDHATKIFPGGQMDHGDPAGDAIECDADGNVMLRRGARTLSLPRAGTVLLQTREEGEELQGDGWSLSWSACPRAPKAGERPDDLRFKGKVFEVARSGTYTADPRTGKVSDATGKEVAAVEAH
jgi:hypothetical protein